MHEYASKMLRGGLEIDNNRMEDRERQRADEKVLNYVQQYKTVSRVGYV